MFLLSDPEDTSITTYYRCIEIERLNEPNWKFMPSKRGKGSRGSQRQASRHDKTRLDKFSERERGWIEIQETNWQDQ